MSAVLPDAMDIRWHLHERNRKSWNSATEAHLSHKGRRADFLRSGGSTLYPEELELLGDISGRRLLHLQCNAGEDTLSLASMGAIVTGIDISDHAISAAQALSRETGLAGDFIRADLYEWLEQAANAQERYDVVFSSYRALCWLSDVTAWAAGVAKVLAPGGRLVVIDTHPCLMMYDSNWDLRYPYQGGEAVETEGVPDYVADSGDGLVPWGKTAGVEGFENPHPDYTFQWGLGEILTALVQAKLRIEVVREYAFANGVRLMEGMTTTGDRRWHPPAHIPPMPIMVAFVAVKP